MRIAKLFTLTALLALASVAASAADMPKSVLHIITVKFKAGTDVEKVMAATKKLAADYPGITRVWLKTEKIQGMETGVTNLIVMEFKDAAAFAAYAGSPAHKAWESVYLAARETSRTHDVTN